MSRKSKKSTANASHHKNATAAAREGGVVPKCADVLFGKSTMAFQWPGNVFLRRQVARKHQQYLAEPTRPKKTKVVRSVLFAIRVSGGRFLKLNPRNNQWQEATNKQCMEKIGHVFRDADKVKYMIELKKELLLERKNESQQQQKVQNGLLSTSWNFSSNNGSTSFTVDGHCSSSGTSFVLSAQFNPTRPAAGSDSSLPPPPPSLFISAKTTVNAPGDSSLVPPPVLIEDVQDDDHHQNLSSNSDDDDDDDATMILETKTQQEQQDPEISLKLHHLEPIPLEQDEENDNKAGSVIDDLQGFEEMIQMFAPRTEADVQVDQTLSVSPNLLVEDAEAPFADEQAAGSLNNDRFVGNKNNDNDNDIGLGQPATFGNTAVTVTATFTCDSNRQQFGTNCPRPQNLTAAGTIAEV